jgi:hypothetical protein
MMRLTWPSALVPTLKRGRLYLFDVTYSNVVDPSYYMQFIAVFRVPEAAAG